MDKRERELPSETVAVKPEPKETEFRDRELTKDDTLQEIDIDNLEVWEGEKRKRYINEIFDTHDIFSDFKWKMPISQIDKYIKAELEERKFEKTTKNFKTVLSEIEAEIKSEPLELWERIQRIVGYLKATENLKKAKTRKEDLIKKYTLQLDS
jgi:hypothetical protein